MSEVSELILSNLSRGPEREDYSNEHYEKKHENVRTYIMFFEDNIPGFADMIENKKILDIGCSEGMEALALSMMGASEVFGIDIRIDNSKNKQIIEQNPDRQLNFAVMDAERTTFSDETFDAIVTCSSFEHFNDPKAILKECQRVLKSDGRIYLTSGVWAHPWGAHMNFFTKVPWVQFLFSESTIMNVRSHYRNDGAKKFAEVEGGLNKIGIRKLLKMVNELNLEVEYLKLKPVKGLSILTKIPLINELFTYLIVAVLRK